MHHVVIIGGGFGGLRAARGLSRAPVQVTLLDRRNYHLFQPLLYQIATGALSPANVAAPLRSLLSRQANVQVLLGEVVDVDVAARRVILRDGELHYDTLIVAAGAMHSYFGHPEWEPLAPGLKTIDDATSIRGRILSAFETAERLHDSQVRQGGHQALSDEISRWLTFVIVGAGPTGVELAGAVAELAHETIRRDFRSIDPTRARIVLVEATDRVLPPFAPKLSIGARSALERMRVEVRTNTLVTAIEPGAVTIKEGERFERIETHTVLWSAGVQASPLAGILAGRTGGELDRGGRIHVLPDLTLPGHPEVMVIGDMANFRLPEGKPLPGLAPVAMQQGNYAARLVAARLSGRKLPPFRYRDLGMMAMIGRMKAVCDLFGVRYSGPFAWLTWLFVHLMQLVQFESRVLVLLQWGWHYLTRNRSARLITGKPVRQADKDPTEQR